MKEKQKTYTKNLKDTVVVMEIPTATEHRPNKIDKIKIYRTNQGIKDSIDLLVERIEYALGQPSTLKTSF